MNKKTLFVTSRGLIEMNNGEPYGKDSSRLAIDRVARITEPTHIIYTRLGEEKRFELDAEPDDILVIFYENTFPTPIILVHSKEWAENIKAYEAREQAEKEAWAKNKLELAQTSCTGCGCDCKG